MRSALATTNGKVRVRGNTSRGCYRNPIPALILPVYYPMHFTVPTSQQLFAGFFLGYGVSPTFQSFTYQNETGVTDFLGRTADSVSGEMYDRSLTLYQAINDDPRWLKTWQVGFLPYYDVAEQVDPYFKANPETRSKAGVVEWMTLPELIEHMEALEPVEITSDLLVVPIAGLVDATDTLTPDQLNDLHAAWGDDATVWTWDNSSPVGGPTTDTRWMIWYFASDIPSFYRDMLDGIVPPASANQMILWDSCAALTLDGLFLDELRRQWRELVDSLKQDKVRYYTITSGLGDVEQGDPFGLDDAQQADLIYMLKTTAGKVKASGNNDPGFNSPDVGKLIQCLALINLNYHRPRRDQNE